MNWVQKNTKYIALCALTILMALTRSDHFGSAISLPDASLAVFYLAGIFTGGVMSLGILLAEAALLDYVAITHWNVSDYCISPAYIFLIPTYATVFLAGHWSKKYTSFKTSDVSIQLVLLFASATIAFFISNGSFYWLSGKFPDLSIVEYAERVAKYYPAYVSSTLIYSCSILLATKTFNMLNKEKETPEVFS